MDLLFSDIHADHGALDSILKVCQSKEFLSRYGEISRILNLGDLLERGTNPKGVLQKMSELSKSYNLKSVMGNHDEAFLYKKIISGSTFESKISHNNLTDSDLEFFSKNDDGTFGSQQFLDTEQKLICVHGGPLDPEKIIPNDTQEDRWLYQKTWQRLTFEDSEFFSYYGYHFKPETAFEEVKTIMNNFIIFSGHQHEEACIKQNSNNIISNEYSNLKKKNVKIGEYKLESKEVSIDPRSNYLIRLGLGGPEGYYGTGNENPHFAIMQNDPKQVILFTIL